MLSTGAARWILAKTSFICFGLADDLVEAEFLIEAAAEVVDFLVLLQPSIARLDEQDQLIGIDRLGEVVVRAGLDRLDGAVHAAVAGQQDELRFRSLLLPELKQIDAADVPHVQVAQDDIDVLIDVADRLVGVFSPEDGKSFGLEDLSLRPDVRSRGPQRQEFGRRLP